MLVSSAVIFTYLLLANFIRDCYSNQKSVLTEALLASIQEAFSLILRVDGKARTFVSYTDRLVT
jgi:hypothetical protein